MDDKGIMEGKEGKEREIRKKERENGAERRVKKKKGGRIENKKKERERKRKRGRK